MAFYKHDFHYDEGEHKQEVERIRQQQSIQKEWLDQQIAEKARLNQEGRRDGRVNHDEYEQFEERRIARFKYNLIRRIIENWSSVTSFDWAEANQLAQVDHKFKEALDAAKADHEAKERNKAQRQEEIQRMQIERLEKDKGSTRNRNGNLEFDVNDPYSKLINAARLNQAQAPIFPNTTESAQPVQEPEPSNTFSRENLESCNSHKVVTLPPLKTANARAAPAPALAQSERQAQSPGISTEHYPYGTPMGAGYPLHPPSIYTPSQPHPIQIITTQQPNNSEIKALLDVLQEQKKSITQADSDAQVEKMFNYFKTKLQEIIVSNEKSIEAAICDGVRKELEDKLSDLKTLMNGIEQKRLESQEKKKRSTYTIDKQQKQIDTGTSMSPKGCSFDGHDITFKRTPIPRSSETNIQQDHAHSIHNDHNDYKYQQLSLNDSIDKIVSVLKERNANRMVALSTKDPQHGLSKKCSGNKQSALGHKPDIIITEEDKPVKQQIINSGLKSILDHLNDLEKGGVDSLEQKTEHSGLLSATEFINRVLQDLKESDNTNNLHS